MSSKETTDILISIAQAKGFQGVRSNKYLFNGRPITGSSLVRQLELPHSLRDINMTEYYRFQTLKLADQKEEVMAALSQIQLVPDISKPDTLNTQDNLESIYESLALYKVSGDHVHDKGYLRSSGYSLVAFNSKTGHLIDWNKLSPEVVLSRRGIKREELSWTEEIPEVLLKFNPLTPELTFQGKDTIFGTGGYLTYANTAVAPYWMKDPAYSKLEPKIGSFIGSLLSHLFPLADEREFILDWCHHLLFKRNGTVLCLAGDRGTGKTTFVEILELLVGQIYSETVNDAVLKDKFNSQFYNKRFIVFEEVSLEDRSAVAKIKAWCNNKLSIEKKGQDAFTADNWVSMAFLMNDISNLGINAQERRFSIPEVASKGLLTSIEEKEVSRFKEGMLNEDPEVLKEIAQFGLFLKARVPKNSEHKPLKGEYFFKVADAAMTEWHYVFREHVLENGIVGKVIPIEKIFPKVGKETNYPHKKGTIEAWLSDYRFKGIHKLGTIVDLDKKKTLDENDFGAVELSSSRTRRNYGVLPNPDLLKDHGKKYSQRAEDLL